MAQFPQELIEAIVDEVEGTKNLQACSLTARAFLAASQSGLFRIMSLRWDSASRNAAVLDRALSFLQEFPHFIPYVRDVTLDIPTSSYDQTTLEAVLRRLRNLERLAINGHAQKWHQVIPSLASTILATISLPTLQRLHLFRIWELPASVVLHAASSVRVLSLNRVSPCIPKDTPADITPNIHLENFILPSCLTTQALLRACNFLLTAQTLRRLAADANTAYYHTLAASSSAHLRHLVLECGIFSTPLDLPHLPALQSITLIVIRSENSEGRWRLPWNLTPAIAALPAFAPVLEALTLTIHIRPLDASGEPLWDDYNAFPVFSSPSYQQDLPHLHNIHCSLGYSDPFVACTGAYFERAFEAL
ncbi:hypothetical protein B0H13DRAFT_2665997 [Mycena leptocephala]|nr:hypothetical protein B0H13DRAFT_2665997 [Mycena leptocephala]